MIHSKTLRNGFIFAEVIMAIALVGFLLTALLVLQASVFKRVVINTSKIDYFYPIKNLLIKEPMNKDEKTSEKKDELYAITLKYEKKDIKPTSCLFRFNGLYQKQSTSKWIEYGKEKEQTVFCYGFEIDEKKQ